MWAFGVCLYEICAGSEPFSGLTNATIAQKVLNGERMTLPLHIDTKLCGLINSCWEQLPQNRPTMSSVLELLNERLFELQAEESSRNKSLDITKMLKAGTILNKIPFARTNNVKKAKKRQQRFFRVSEDLRRLTWSKTVGNRRLSFGNLSTPSSSSMHGLVSSARITSSEIKIADIDEIFVGPVTPNFKEWRRSSEVNFSAKCEIVFSIATANRTIDIICPSDHIKNYWVRGLSMLKKRLQVLGGGTSPTVGNKKYDIYKPVGGKSYLEAMQKRLIFSRMNKGDYFLRYKLTKVGFPHERFLRLEFCYKRWHITWLGGVEEEVARKLNLSEVKEIKQGKVSPAKRGDLKRGEPQQNIHIRENRIRKTKYV